MDDTTADTRAGSQFGPYLLRRLVGRGGMGDVYEAEDTVRERVVALKLMSPTLSNDPVFRSRMQR
ncbi:serine/threonine protein kinase, partial [Mycobacterium tuberculosis]|nr:serine/threonine protein kinase [Mycobacterium tuberculosis]